MNNNIKTFILLAAIVALFMVIGELIGGKSGMLVALIFAGILNIGAYWFSSDIILRMYNAQEVGPHNAPDLYQIVTHLANVANIPMPKVYVINESQPNAFATGRNPNHAAVAFTIGIMELLDHDEIATVAAHELSHIKHYDTLISTISAVVAGAISAIANFALFFGARDEERRPNLVAGILIAIFAPIAAAIIQMAISRSREYLADEGAAYLTRDPLTLARALQKIDSYARNGVMQTAEKHPATAQMMIINPLTDSKHDNLFSTHPNTQNRIDRLYQISQNL
jgi:heat shock protein HtpX